MSSIPRIVAAALLLASCARTEEPVAVQTASAQMPMESCPMTVDGTDVSVVDTEGGVALVFTTATGEVAQLRDRVQRMADMHEQQMSGDMMGHMGHEQMQGDRAQMRMMPEADLDVRTVEGGALLNLTPRDPTQLADLRQHARTHADEMNTGRCPMMQMEHRMPAGT